MLLKGGGASGVIKVKLTVGGSEYSQIGLVFSLHLSVEKVRSIFGASWTMTLIAVWS